MQKTYLWEDFSEKELLKVRLSDLGLSLANSWVEKEAHQLYKTLAKRHLNFTPHLWIADDWFCPDGVPGIAVPFYILHAKLWALEKKMIGTVEGGDARDCQRYLRHECGHAIDNAFKLRLSKSRQKLFGKSSTPYPEQYTFRPYSKNYVRHFEEHYAQAHPDEDWAETFAVWLSPKKQWQTKYTGHKALQKLHFIDQSMKKLQYLQPRTENQLCPYALNVQKITLREYYTRKRKRLGLSGQDFYGKNLSELFRPSQAPCQLTYRGIQRWRPTIRSNVAKKTGYPQYLVEQMLQTLTTELQKNQLKLIRKTRLPQQIEKLLMTQTDRFIKQGRHRIKM